VATASGIDVNDRDAVAPAATEARGSGLVRGARRVYRAAVRAAVDLSCRVGLNLARSRDYYSPLPVYSELARRRGRWDRPSALGGVTYDLDTMRALTERLVRDHGASYHALPSYHELKESGAGPGFTVLDGMFLFFMLRAKKPRLFVEVGSGLSTCYASLALAANAAEGSPGEIRCIDPHVRPQVRALDRVEVVAREVQDVEPSFFAQLGRGDVLFIDSTHVVKIDGDVPHLYLEVLPALQPGVTVHAHDVHFPYNTPHPAERYVLGRTWPMLWTEAMLLQAFLAYNASFRVVLSLPLLRHFDEAFLRRAIPGYRAVEPEDHDTHFGSIWLERVG
jgi:predicted O-methyltransferase YrrM